MYIWQIRSFSCLLSLSLLSAVYICMYLFESLGAKCFAFVLVIWYVIIIGSAKTEVNPSHFYNRLTRKFFRKWLVWGSTGINWLNLSATVYKMRFVLDSHLIFLLKCLTNNYFFQGTVAYNLLLDNQFSVSGGYLRAEFQETMVGLSPSLLFISVFIRSLSL